MKKKIALLLAGTMVLSTMPLGVFAASNNYVSNVVGIDAKTLLTSSSDVWGLSEDSSINDLSYDYIDHAPVLAIELKNSLTANNGTFKLSLSNAKWAYGAPRVLTVGAEEIRLIAGGEAGTSTATYEYSGTNDILAGSVIEIPLEVVTTSTKTASVGITGAAGGVTSTTENIKFADLKSSSKTKVTSADVENVDDETISFSLKFTEQQVGTIQAGDEIYLELDDPDQDWALLTGTGAPVVDLAEFGGVTGVRVSPDGNVLTIKLPTSADGFDVTDKLPGTLTIKNLRVESDEFGDLVVNVSSKGKSVNTQDVNVGSFLEYGIKASIDKDATVPTIKAGRVANEGATSYSDMDTLEVTVEELLPHTFREKDALVFTLPEGVDVTAVELTTVDGIKYISNDGTTELSGRVEDLGGNTTSGGSITAYGNDRVFDITDNVVTFDNGVSIADEKVKLGVKFYIKTAYDFSGDVDVVVSGKAVEDKDLEVGKVAEVKSLFTVESKTTNIPVGYTNLDTSDIVISETESGSFVSGDKFTLSLKSENINKGALQFAKKPSFSVEGGNLNVKNTARSDDKQDVTFTVTGRTNKSDDLGSVTISDVQVYADRTVPNTNGDALKLNLSSVTSFANSVDLDYLTTGNGNSDNNGIGENYSFNENVVFNLNSTVVSVDGTEVTQDAAPYISSNSGSTMIPVRALSEALGVAPENVLWHQPTQSVTIIVSPSRTAQFQLDSDLCYINGVAVPMVGASGKSDVVEYSNNRVFLPVRFLGEKVFQVPVVWEGNTVRFN